MRPGPRSHRAAPSPSKKKNHTKQASWIASHSRIAPTTNPKNIWNSDTNHAGSESLLKYTPQRPRCKDYSLVNFRRMAEQPESEQLSRYFSQMGKKGAEARNKRLTPEQRRDIATKASKAAAKARTSRAKRKGPKPS